MDVAAYAFLKPGIIVDGQHRVFGAATVDENILLPKSLWGRTLDSSSSIQEAGQRHLADLGLDVSTSRLQAIQNLYQEFASTREKVPVTSAALTKNNYRCEHCGIAFCNEDLASKNIISPHHYRRVIKIDPFKLHWSRSDYRIPTMDHDWPVTTFGSNSTTNLRVLCRGCNEGKADYLALEQMGAWSGLYKREQLINGAVPLSLFYAQIRKEPMCSESGARSDTSELTVELRDPKRPAVFDNLITVVSPDP